jgi:hypothetical protein
MRRRKTAMNIHESLSPMVKGEKLSSNDTVRVVPAATVIGVGWDIIGARDGGEEDGEGGEGIHESNFGRM